MNEEELTWTIGIDEVGRGPLAGPVCVCALAHEHKPAPLKSKVESLKLKEKLPLRDSKKLTKKQREKWVEIINKWCEEGICKYAISMVAPSAIDRLGISRAIENAVSESLYRLKTNNYRLVLLDGGLKAPKEFINQKTIIKGDEKEPVIALASIVAKVHRDTHMKNLAEKFPNYGFERNSGYGTMEHRQAISVFGPCEIHRKSYLRNILKKNRE